MPEELLHKEVWWQGPKQLFHGECDTTNENQLNYDEDGHIQKEMKANVMTAVSELQFRKRYSSFNKLKRVTAYCLRFLNNLKGQRKYGALATEELEDTGRKIVWTVQRESFPTVEEFYTLFNSRPITKLSDDPNDLNILTPFHFLIGDTLHMPVEYNFLESPINRLSRWQHLQKLRQRFWQRWQREYLHHLQTRNRWNTRSENVKIGELVLLIED